MTEPTLAPMVRFEQVSKRYGALTVLEPLVSQRDRAAWRTRAFVLALTGDQAGAQRAVNAVMPGTQATAMGQFFGRLGQLKAPQKALAVREGKKRS